jgi:hypothetical protein
MQPQEKHDVVHLEKQINDLSKQLTKLATEQEFKELIINIRQPGWTTPAEFRFAVGIVDSMLAQTKALGDLKRVLIDGSRAVGNK